MSNMCTVQILLFLSRILTPKQQAPSPPSLCNPKFTTVTHYTAIFLILSALEMFQQVMMKCAVHHDKNMPPGFTHIIPVLKS